MAKMNIIEIAGFSKMCLLSKLYFEISELFLLSKFKE